MTQDTNKRNLTPGGSPRWWTDAKNTQVLPDLRRWRRNGLTWNAIAEELKDVVHPATLSQMYRKNFGKLTPKDLADLYPPEPPNVEPPSKMTIDDFDVVWKKLQEGYPYALVIQILMRRKCFKEERRARDYLNKWLRSAAEDVWEMPAEEMLARRVKKTRKSAKRLNRLDNLRRRKAVSKTVNTPSSDEKKVPSDILEFATEKGKFIWNTSEDPPMELLLEVKRIQSKFIENRTAREFALYYSWIKALCKYAVDLDRLEI